MDFLILVVLIQILLSRQYFDLTGIIICLKIVGNAIKIGSQWSLMYLQLRKYIMTKLTEGWKSKERKIRLKKGIMRMLSFSCYLLLFVFVKKKKKNFFCTIHTYMEEWITSHLRTMMWTHIELWFFQVQRSHQLVHVDLEVLCNQVLAGVVQNHDRRNLKLEFWVSNAGVNPCKLLWILAKEILLYS